MTKKLTKSQLTTRKRQSELERLISFYTAEGEEVLRPSGSSLVFPSLDEEGNEVYVKLTISIPRGSRLDGEAYDGHQEAEEYTRHLEAVAARKAVAEKEKADKARKREEKLANQRLKKEAETQRQEQVIAQAKELEEEGK